MIILLPIVEPLPANVLNNINIWSSRDLDKIMPGTMLLPFKGRDQERVPSTLTGSMVVIALRECEHDKVEFVVLKS